MKRIITALICILCFVMVAGCGKSDKKAGNNQSATTQSVSDSATSETTATYDIKTSVTTLKYSAAWKDKVTTEVTDKRVTFKNGDKTVFEIVFEDCDGYLLGTYNGTPVYIIEHDDLTDEEALMVEDVNVILENLMKDDKFVVNKGNQE